MSQGNLIRTVLAILGRFLVEKIQVGGNMASLKIVE
jgi:hypothetical protein